MTINIVQHSWTHGEISPQMIARSDLEIYRKCAKQMRNLVVIPQGGARRRFGLDYIADLTGDAGSDEYMLGWFQLSEDENYLLVFLPLKIDIYKDDFFLDSVVTPYTGTQLANKEVKFSQSGNSMVIVHPDYPPKELSFTPPSWPLIDITFRNLPVYDFKRNYDGITFTLESVKVKEGVSLTANSAIFDSSYIGGLFEGYGEDLADELGRARITSLDGTTPATKAYVTIITPFAGEFSTGGMKGSSCFLGQPAWSSTYGYPSSVDFYEGRLIFGGSKSLPQTIFGSVVDDKFNFDLGRGLDSDAIQITLQKTNAIKYVVGDKDLQIFTANDEYASVQPNGTPLTPTNLPFRKQSSNGIHSVQPVILDNQTFFVQRGGKRVMSYVFNDSQSSYQAVDVSILSTHLIVNPVDGAAFKNDLHEDSNYVFLVNDDGTLACFQTLAAENVAAWTLSTTIDSADKSKFKRVVAVDSDIYFIVERTINGSTKQYLEKLNFDSYTDSTLKFTYGSLTSVITGLSHLEGETVRVLGNDVPHKGNYNLGEYQVTGGEIDLGEIEVIQAEVGLGFAPLLETLPLDLQTQAGPIAYAKKRIVNITIDYYNSLGIYVNETLLVPFRTFLEKFDYPPSDPQTGIEELKLLEGWAPRTTLTISQKDPLPMTILAINFEVEI